MAKSDNEYRDINKAFNLSLFALVGIFIPLVGIVLGIAALSLVNSQEPKTNSGKSKKTTVTILSILAIVLSVIAGLIYFNYYRNVNKQQEINQQSAIQTTLEENKTKQTECKNQAMKNSTQGAMTAYATSDPFDQRVVDAVTASTSQNDKLCETQFPTK